jgi:hypothetical protein
MNNRAGLPPIPKIRVGTTKYTEYTKEKRLLNLDVSYEVKAIFEMTAFLSLFRVFRVFRGSNSFLDLTNP